MSWRRFFVILFAASFAITSATRPWVAQLFVSALGFLMLVDALVEFGFGLADKFRDSWRFGKNPNGN